MFEGALVQRVLDTIAAWPADESFRIESEVRDGLAEHLIDAGFDVVIERSIRTDFERRQIDLVVADTVAIELKLALRRVGESDRATGQLLRYAEA